MEECLRNADLALPLDAVSQMRTVTDCLALRGDAMGTLQLACFALPFCIQQGFWYLGVLEGSCAFPVARLPSALQDAATSGTVCRDCSVAPLPWCGFPASCEVKGCKLGGETTFLQF